MTEQDIHRGFATNNEAIMGKFYDQNYSRFNKYFRAKYGKSDEYLSDLYMEAYEALWNNIHSGRLPEAGLKSSLYSYLIGVAENMLKATDRKTKNLLKVNLFYKEDGEADEILDDRVRKHLQAEAEGLEDKERLFELQDFVDRAVADMKPPCNELLRNFYWNRISGEEIAEEMNYSNADSVKIQKSKCMGKLKPLVKQFAKL